jgi:coenzyme F420 hydrogenase subunit beta
METFKNISYIVKNGLCTGCGTCEALCPAEAIKLLIDKNKGVFIPQLVKDKCNKCGICLKVCPGHEVDFKELNLEIFGKEPENLLIGNYINCYVGHTNDNNIRYNSSSGGLVTAILIFALEKGLIDGALVTRMRKDKPLEPEPFIARTREEVIEASKSKYCPVPANIALREIMEVEGKYAVVGLPCHIHGLRKAQRINKKLRERIVLHLGIFCNHAPNFWGTKLLLHRLKIKEDEVIKLDYRGCQ